MKILRNAILAGALALGAAAAKADGMPNINNLPLTCPSIVPREVIRNVADERAYVSLLGGDASRLVVVETQDPRVRVGEPYRAPLGPQDFLDVVMENRQSPFSTVAPSQRKEFSGGISASRTAPELVPAGKDYLITTDELPYDEGTFTYWAKAFRFNPFKGDEQCASVSYPITAYRETPEPKAVPQPPVAVERATPVAPASTPPAKTAVHVKKELSVLVGKGVDQYTADDSRGNRYSPIDFDLTSVAARYRWLGNKGKVDLQGAVTQGDDKAGLKLRALDAEIHSDYKLFKSRVSPGFSVAAGVKDVRTYWDLLPGFTLEDSRQANGYGFLGLNVAFTGDGGFASENYAILRAGAVAQPIIDKKVSFDGFPYASTTDMEIAYPEVSFEARKLLGRAYVDAQVRGSPKIETLYTSPNTDRELTRTSEYLNATLGFGYRFDKVDAYVQGKWAHNSETWKGLRDIHGAPYTLKTNHEGLSVRGGVVFRFGSK